MLSLIHISLPVETILEYKYQIALRERKKEYEQAQNALAEKQQDYAMSTSEIIMAIINAAAIIIVPIAAVFVGQKLQDRNQKRKDKMAIFQCLMTHRATGWAHQDTVNALNTIDIIFVDDESCLLYTSRCV